MAQTLLKHFHSPIPCEVLLKSLHYVSWHNLLWNPSIRLFSVKSFKNPFISGHGPNSSETLPFAYSLWSPFKISPLGCHGPNSCETPPIASSLWSPFKISPLRVMAKFLWNPSIRLFSVKSFYNLSITGHGPNSSETPSFTYSLSSPFKIFPLRVMAQILLKPLRSPIPCQVLLKSLNFGSSAKFLWNPSTRLIPVKSL